MAGTSWSWVRTTIGNSQLSGATATYTERVQVPVGSSVQRILVQGQMQAGSYSSVGAPLSLGPMPIQGRVQVRVSPDASEGEYLYSVSQMCASASEAQSESGTTLIFTESWWFPVVPLSLDITARKRITATGGGVDIVLAVGPLYDPNPGLTEPSGLWIGGFFTQVLVSTPA